SRVAAVARAGLRLARRRGARAEDGGPDRTKRLADAFEASDAARAIGDRDGAVSDANGRFTEAFGGAGDLADALEEKLQDDESRAALAALCAAAEGGAALARRLALLGPGGAEEIWRVAVAPLPDGALWTLTDETADAAAEARAQAATDKRLDLLDALPAGAAAFDEKGRIIAANAALADWLGYPDGEALAAEQPAAEAVLADGGGGAGLSALRAVVDAEGRGGVALRGRDGEPGPTTRLRLKATAAGAVAFFRRREREDDFEAALRKSELRFQRIFEEAPVGIALVAADGRISAANAAFRRFAARAGEDRPVGRAMVDLLDTETAPLVAHIFGRPTGAMRSVGPVEVRFRGEPAIDAALYAAPAEDGVGHAAGYVLHVLDASEQKRLEAQFAQSQKMQAVGQLAGGVAHDFNNMLTAIIGNAEMLMTRHRPSDKSFVDADAIRQCANRSADLVRKLLAFSRQQPLRPKVVDVGDVLAELTHMLQRLIGENITLKIVHARDLWPVRVDATQLEQALTNLAVNARDAINAKAKADGAAPRGTVTFRLSNVSTDAPLRRGAEEAPPGDYVRIDAEDDGCGVPSDLLARIFEPFYTTKAVGEGSGLGLSTVYGMVRQTDGIVFADSTLGAGATFSIFLPRHRAKPGDAAEEARASQPAGDLSGKGAILLVEDEDPVRVFGARALRQKGYTVLEARGGEQALQLLEDEAGGVDLLISDVVMPEMDGPELARRVRERDPAMKIVFISGYAEESFRERLGEDESIHFLPKPFSLKQLAGKVKEAMGGR
ncbi:MAG: response regulator, partial [Pseudomonadota bacterium]